VLDADVPGAVHDSRAHRLYLALPAGARVEREGGRQVAVGGDLLLQVADLLLGDPERGGAGDEAARRRLLGRDRHQRPAELGRIARLLSVLRVPPRELRRGALGVVVDRRRGVARGRVREELGPEETRIDDGGVNPERRDLGCE
jgi:hypothetical protein